MAKREKDGAFPLGCPRIFCLSGELGAGKTTLLQGFAQGLGLHTRLLSPTFIIVRRYGLENTMNVFYHIDLYRIQKEEDLKSLGLMEVFSHPYAIIAVEWPERLGKFMPQKRIDITFEVTDEEKRKIIMKQLT